MLMRIYMNPFPFSDDNKRYHTLSHYIKQHGISAYKASVDAGFTCPNIDGSRGTGGCIYCDGGSGYFSADAAVPIAKQIDLELERIRKKHPGSNAIAYFQAHTNTYAPVKILRELFKSAVKHEGICGISIATRADALPEDVLDYLSQLNERTNLTVELGLQTVNDNTAALINRCHSFSDFIEGYSALKNRGISTCAHLINGLPGEDDSMMLQSATVLGRLSPDAVKLHSLHVIKGTILEELYRTGQYQPISFENYVDICIRQLEVLPPKTVIERITGDADKRTLVAPVWGKDKIRVLGTIDKVMAERDTWQGKYLEPPTKAL
jgi:radical SAM protein (TIGR01212 family)